MLLVCRQKLLSEKGVRPVDLWELSDSFASSECIASYLNCR